MASCKDCIHFEVCDSGSSIDEFMEHGTYTNGVEKECDTFKDRNRFVELPCKFGDIVYEMVLNRDKSFSHWNIHEVVGVHLGDFPDLRGHKRQEYLVTFCKIMNFLGRIPLNKLGETVFLSREEAEKALNNPAKSDS